MTPPGRHVAHATLELLTEPHSVSILRALMDGPRRPSELEQRLPDVPHSALMRRLGDLRQRGLAIHERQSGLPPSAEYALTAPGRMILRVTGAAERWERRWTTTESADGLAALRRIGDERTREILLALARRPLSAGEILADVQLTRSPLRQRLGALVEDEVLKRNPGQSHATFELTHSARDLMLVAVAATRWRWECDRPDDPPAAGDIARLIRMFAPNAQLPADLEGLCRLGVGTEVVDVAVSGRSIAALDEPPTAAPNATCRADPPAWADGLLLLRWSGVVSTGNRALMAAVLASTSSALVA
jgi:DNA-binding HxlR family transcriptional regulator